MKFSYKGVTRQREEVSGSLEATDEMEARIKLRGMQIRPTALRVAVNAPINVDFKNLQVGSVIDLKGMMVFTRQFSSLIDSGVPVVQCLDILWQQEQRKAFKAILGRLKTDIESGSGLAESLARHPKVFNDFFIRIVEAGEVSGTLDKALRRIGVQLEKLGRLKAKVIGALTYPLITLVVAVVVLCFLLVKVIPEVAKLYGDKKTLPALTQFVLEMSEWVQQYYLFVAGGLAGAFFLMVTFYRIPEFRRKIDYIVIQVPLFGSLIRKATIARLTRTMSTLLSSGVPLINAFDICTRLVDNQALKDVVSKTAQMVQEGKSIAQGLAGGGSLFPPMVIHMVNIGEMTGRLDDLLGKVADIYDDEVDDAVGQLTGMLQPVMIVGVGIIIAFLLVAMYMPIFSLAEKVVGG